MFSSFKVLAIGLLATIASAVDEWSHAEIHYGDHNQIEGVSLLVLTNNST